MQEGGELYWFVKQSNCHNFRKLKTIVHTILIS